MQNSHISHFQNAEEEGGLEIQPGNSNGVNALKALKHGLEI